MPSPNGMTDQELAILDILTKPEPMLDADPPAESFAAYLRCASCFKTPSMVPISHHGRSASRAARIASRSGIDLGYRSSRDV